MSHHNDQEIIKQCKRNIRTWQHMMSVIGDPNDPLGRGLIADEVQRMNKARSRMRLQQKIDYLKQRM